MRRKGTGQGGRANEITKGKATPAKKGKGYKSKAQSEKVTKKISRKAEACAHIPIPIQKKHGSLWLQGSSMRPKDAPKSKGGQGSGGEVPPPPHTIPDFGVSRISPIIPTTLYIITKSNHTTRSSTYTPLAPIR